MRKAPNSSEDHTYTRVIRSLIVLGMVLDLPASCQSKRIERYAGQPMYVFVYCMYHTIIVFVYCMCVCRVHVGYLYVFTPYACSMHLYVCMYVCMHVYVDRMYVCTYTHACVYVRMYVVRMYVCMYVSRGTPVTSAAPPPSRSVRGPPHDGSSIWPAPQPLRGVLGYKHSASIPHMKRPHACESELHGRDL